MCTRTHLLGVGGIDLAAAVHKCIHIYICTYTYIYMYLVEGGEVGGIDLVAAVHIPGAEEGVVPST